MENEEFVNVLSLKLRSLEDRQIPSSLNLPAIGIVREPEGLSQRDGTPG